MLARPKMKAVDAEGARQDLAAANAALDAIRARELECTDTAAAFNAWRAERDTAIAEVERLSKLIERLKSAADEETLREQQAALQKQVDEQRQANERLAARIKTEGGTAIKKLLELVRDVATAAITDEALNAKLPDDAEKIKSADMLARHRVPAPRENLSEKTVSLWVFASNGSAVGDQDDVVATGDGDTGFLRGSQQYKTQVVRRKFRSVSYLKAGSHQPLVPFFAALRLPSPDGPGLVWDPSANLSAATALEALKHRSAVAERETLTELVPVEPFVPLAGSAGWHRAGSI